MTGVTEPRGQGETWRVLLMPIGVLAGRASASSWD